MAFKDQLKAAASKVQESAKDAQQRAKQAKQESKDENERIAATRIFQGTSHEEGRNSVVSLYPDRLERVKEHSFTSLNRARQETEVTPIAAISSVGAEKDGMMRTKVTVYASGNNIVFRFAHDEAQRFKNELLTLIANRDASGSRKDESTQDDVMEQLRKLGELKDAGVLTEAEFQEKKADLLGRI